MAEDFDDRLTAFLDTLRGEEARPGATGLRRFGRTIRGAAGLAGGVVLSKRRAAKGALGEADLARMEALVRRLGDLKGLPMKAGQILGYLEADVPEELRRLLALLQTQSQPTPFEQVEAILREDLGDDRAAALLARLDRLPVSTASIGQVHRARLPDGTEVAVKVRHPDIEASIRADFQGASAGTGFARMIVPGAGKMARAFMEEARDRLLEECDYGLEAERQRRFGRLFGDDPAVVVPDVHDAWCGPRVLTTTWQDGQDFEAFAASAPQAARDAAARALFEVYIGALYRHGLFHADPHPGNYRFRDGQVVVFDFGCVRAFEPGEVRAFAALTHAVRDADEDAMRRALTELGAVPPSDAKAFAHVRGLLESFFGPMRTPGPHPIDAKVAFDARRIMEDKLAMMRLRLPGKLLFLFRIRFGLYSVLARLGAVLDWAALEEACARDAFAGPA